MRSYYRNFCWLFFGTLLCFGLPSICLCQSTAGWTVETAPNSVKLISVEQVGTMGGLKFTFQNVSGKTIINFSIDDLHGIQTGRDAFVLGGVGAVAPGGKISFEFNSQDFSGGAQNAHTLRVNAIFYGDGSRFGLWSARMEDEMLGEALETRRGVHLLSASPDPSIAGFNNVVAQLRSQPLDTLADAVLGLRGATLPGVSRAYINRHLPRCSLDFLRGAKRARQMILTGIATAKSNDARMMAGDRNAQRWELARRPHALSDFAKKWALRSEWQATYIKELRGKGRLKKKGGSL